MAVLLLAEHDNKSLAPATARVLAAAEKFGGEVDILVAGEGARGVAAAAAKLAGVRKVLLAGAQGLLAPAPTMGKNVAPRVAALLDVAQVSDLIEVKAPDTFVRPVYAGNALE